MARRVFPSREESANEIAELKNADKLVGSYQSAALSFKAASRRVDWLTDPSKMGASLQLALFLFQLEEEGLGECSHDGEMVVTWQQVYRIKSSRKYGTCYPLLRLPPQSTLRPCLASHGSFSDSGFSIFVSGWVGDDGSPPMENPRISGAIVTTGQQEALLAPEVWQTLAGVAAFHERKMEERTTQSNQVCWANIRQHAKAAGAKLSHFLESTVVVAPETLTVELRKSDIAVGTMVEVLPTFKGQPAAWVDTFDRFGQVRDHYEVPDGAGLTHVLITPQVRTVLSEIKRMPGRRVAGARAEAFVRNPFATLGPDADEVIDEKQFEQARVKAGISFARFTAQLQHDGPDSELSVGLLIEEGDTHTGSSHALPFADPGELEEFIAKVGECAGREAQCCSWRGYELEILGDTPDQLVILRGALQKWRRNREYKPSEIFDLSHYSQRVAGFGIEKPYYLPIITRKKGAEGWFPDNVIFAAQYKPEGTQTPVAAALSVQNIQQLEQALRTAKDKNQAGFVFPGFPEPIAVREAEAMVTAFREAERDVAARRFNMNKAGSPLLVKMNGLIVKPNVDEVDYAEPYGDLAVPAGSKPFLPTSLRRNVALLEHQLSGVAWLQHLWGRSPRACRGALLADDMGLGKTLQLLTFIVWCLEHDSAVDPFLIVAPVSLLENWKQEIDKFFEPGTLPVLTLYGPALREKRLPRAAIQEELLRAGIARLLIRGWLGNAKVVLTTYETLRDLEFSLARQRWSVMVCDEAQKIKTPNAMVSRAAKKQNARFKIACTGTPVENTLTDLWCLFDFIQPGLLGSLRCFAERYRRPIEAETDEEKTRVEELRRMIASQTLRRSKAEVAEGLPLKVVDRGCRSLLISEEQRVCYNNALAKFKRGYGAGPPAGLYGHFGLLLHLRQVCCDPRPPGEHSFKLQSLAELERCSPKMKWMLNQLRAIEAREEKAIVFCEFRELQRTIQHAIFERLGLLADIINGDTSAAGERTDNRQKRIETFQKKPGFGVIILSPAAVGFGVNIQAANHVIHFTRAWNPAREDQATDRAYRIGQNKDVFVYYPVVVAEDFVTFDEKLDRLLEIKRRLSQDMLNGCNDVGPSDFSDLKNCEGSTLLDVLPEGPFPATDSF
jgi:SNF2-related domain/Helicase conserved C-terminal domain